MKKVLSLIFALALCLSIMTVAAFADGSVALGVSSDVTSAAPGDTVTVTVSMNSNPGIAALQLDIEYDATRLEKVSYEGTGLSGWVIGDDANWIAEDLSNSTYTGGILVLTYKVLDGAPAGDAAVSVAVVEADDENVNIVAGSGASASVTVTAAACTEHQGEVQNAVAATCTADGYTGDTVCTVCGETIAAGEVIPATGHALAEAADNGDGTHTGVCATCGETVTVEHTWDEGAVTTEATTEAEGVKTYTCTACGATTTEAIAKLEPAEQEEQQEQQEQPQVQVSKPSSSKPTSPATGDETNDALLYVVLALVSVTGLAIVAMRARKESR